VAYAVAIDHHDRIVVAGSTLTPLLVAASTANSLILSNGYRDRTTLRAQGAIRLEKLPTLPIDLAFAGIPGTDPALALAGAIHATLAGLWANPHEELRIEGLDLEIEVRPAVVSYVVESVNYERGRLAPGEPLTVRVVLRGHREERITRTLELALPERLPRAGTLTLAVGSPAGIESALGDRIARRVRTRLRTAQGDFASCCTGSFQAPLRISSCVMRRTSTWATPVMRSLRAAARLRSMMRPLTNGPRSLTLTTTCRPLAGLRTSA